MKKQTPLVIGHRGAMGEAPENTLKSFELALKQGADGIELDVFLSKDGEVVVTHDEHLKRLTGHNLKTRQSTLKELKNLDFGQGEKIPTLKEVLDLFGQKFSVINIEIKSTGLFTDGIEKKVAAIISDFGLVDRVLVSSFNLLNLIRLSKISCQIPRGYLSSVENWYIPPALGVPLCRASSVNMNFQAINPEIIHYYGQQKKQIWVWTVNSQKDMAFWAAQPVSAIITNYPGRLRKLISRG